MAAGNSKSGAIASGDTPRSPCPACALRPCGIPHAANIALLALGLVAGPARTAMAEEAQILIDLHGNGLVKRFWLQAGIRENDDPVIEGTVGETVQFPDFV